MKIKRGDKLKLKIGIEVVALSSVFVVSHFTQWFAVRIQLAQFELSCDVGLIESVNDQFVMFDNWEVGE